MLYRFFVISLSLLSLNSLTACQKDRVVSDTAKVVHLCKRPGCIKRFSNHNALLIHLVARHKIQPKPLENSVDVSEAGQTAVQQTNPKELVIDVSNQIANLTLLPTPTNGTGYLPYDDSYLYDLSSQEYEKI